MNAYYQKTEVPINDEDNMMLYEVYNEAVRGDGFSTHSIYKPIGIYDNEAMAKAVVAALEIGLI